MFFMDQSGRNPDAAPPPARLTFFSLPRQIIARPGPALELVSGPDCPQVHPLEIKPPNPR